MAFVTVQMCMFKMNSVKERVKDKLRSSVGPIGMNSMVLEIACGLADVRLNHTRPTRPNTTFIAKIANASPSVITFATTIGHARSSKP